jgi:alkanesulfonate monooxygenase SsuD/methylene tetrahydromethanopterin reductase-like flavin-dependent oxidoreductase (luciferase family)
MNTHIFQSAGELHSQAVVNFPRNTRTHMTPSWRFAAATAVTKRIMLSTGICLVIERDPIVLAKEVASLDRISDGRVILGVGAGWNVEEMENHGTSYKQRWKILRERVLAMREIWTGDVAQFHGEFVDFEPLWSWPKPIQKPGPKILLGSRSQRCFERVVDYCGLDANWPARRTE